MYTFEQLKADVLHEANNIKTHATAEEIASLDFETLDPNRVHRCIYGQMTGHCDSSRAIELIQKCTARYVVDNQVTAIRFVQEGFNRIINHLNGETVENLNRKRPTAFLSNETAHYSMIEAYILLPEAKNKSLIAYIKGETEILEL